MKHKSWIYVYVPKNPIFREIFLMEDILHDAGCSFGESLT